MRRLKRSLLCILMAVMAAFCLCFAVACDDEEFSYEGETGSPEYVQIYNLNANNTPVQMAIVGGRFTFRAPTRAGLVFEGLYDAAGLMIVDQNGNCLIEVQNGLQLYARWAKMNCTLLFDAGEDGTLAEDERSQTYEYDSALFEFGVPTPVQGKEFVGWMNNGVLVTDEDGNLLEDKDVLTGENFKFNDDGKTVQFTAQYKIQTFTYTFDYQNDEYENVSGVVEYGATFGSIKTEFPELIDTGSRELVGWSISEYTMVELNEEELIEEDTTFYAIWKEYRTFYFYEDKGVAPTPVKIYQGNNDTYQPAKKNGYAFIGWYTNDYFGGNAVQSINYYSSYETYWARWEMETYTLTFDSNGGGSFAPVKYTIEDYKELPVPQKENFTFVGWCMEEDLSDTPRTAITVGSFGGGTMYAKYKGIDRTAKLQTNGGTLAQTQTTVEYGAKYTLPVPTYEGFAFAGWYDGDGDSATKLTDSKGVSYGTWNCLDEETTLYAKYTKKYYIHIEYKGKDGLATSVGATAQVEEYYVSGEPAKFTVTVEEGYYYGGIYNSNGARVTHEKEYTFTMPAADCTFVVEVYPQTYTLTFEMSGGTMESTLPVQVTYGENFTLPVPYKKAHLFKGWLYQEELCTNEYGESLSTTQITANGKLTAKFEINPAFENYTEITTADEFMAIANNTSGVYVLGANIDLSRKDWTAVDFSGMLDGSGFKISGLKTSLFNAVTGTVKNLKLDVNISVTNTGDCQQIGGFAKVANGNAVIENITVYGSINTEGNYDCGGVLGGTSNGSPIIRNCKNYATVTSVNNGNQTGGVIGALHVIGGEIYGCENYGAVSGKNAAGVCAWIRSAMTFKECINEGNVTGTELAGGIVAYLGGKATINACGSYGTVTLNGAAGGKYVGQNNVSYVNLKPIYITEASELLWLSNCIAQEVFVLKNDIDLSGTTWTPFNFGATLDGAGHKIKNLTVSSASGDLGFFLTLTGTVKNLKFENVNIESTSDTLAHVGTACAVLGANGLLQKVEVLSGNVKGVFADIGGIVGIVNGKGTIEGCKNYASVTATATTADTGTTGGIVGHVSNTDGLVRDCENVGTVQGVYRVGGVIGSVNMSGTRAFNNLVNRAAVTGSADYIGGVIGLWSAGGNLVIEAAMRNEGAVTGVNYVGGVFGRLYNTLGANNNYTMKLRNYTNSGTIYGEHCVGGVFGWLKADNTYGYSITMQVSEMKNTGNVTAKTDEAGGIAGYVFAENTNSTLSGVSSGVITAETEVGGIVGWYDNGTLTDCSNAGTSVVATKYSTDSNGVKYAYVGGFAGHAPKVVNCHNAVNITYTAGGRFVGGIAGRSDGEFVNCSNTGAITALDSEWVGGLAGYVYSGGNRTMKNLKNSGVVKGINYVGGIFGRMYNELGANNHYTMTYTDVENSGEIVATGNYVGGLFGYMHGNNTYGYMLKVIGTEWKNTGDVTGKTHVGGFVGYAYSDDGASYISGSSNATIKAESRVGGLAGWLDNIRLTDCSNEGSSVTATKYEMDSQGNYFAYLGGYAGKGHGFINCHNAVALTYAEKGVYVGGIAGYADNVFTNCSNTGAITATGTAYLGGLAGYVRYNGTITFSELVNSGAVTGKEYVGGIFGRMYNELGANSNYIMTYTDIQNSGEIVATGDYVGGLIGYLFANNTYSYSTKIVGSEWKNTGDVTGKTYVGGFLGYTHSDDGSSMISGSSGAKIKAEAKIGGLVGWTDNVQLVDCSNTGTTITATKYYLDTNTTTYYAYIGGFAGKGDALTNCHNAADISYQQRGIYVGGIAGYVDDKLANCSNTGNIRAASSDYVGGLVGYASYGGYTFTYSELENSGVVTGVNYVGGLFGRVREYVGANANYTISLQTAENSGCISATGDYVGGLIGHFYGYNHYGSYAVTITVMEAKNTGDVTGIDAAYVGGLFGYAYGESTSSKILTSSSSANVTGGYYVGGLAGWLENIVVQDCSNEGSTVTATETFVDGTTYYAYVGGFAGRGYSFISCTNKVDITYSKAGTYVGGFAGYINGALTDCTNEGDVLAENAYKVGGLVGYAEHSSNVSHSGLTNKGQVKGNANVGGIFGHINGSVGANANYNITLSLLTNEGDVTGTGGCVGGIAGYLYANNSYGYTYGAIMSGIENSATIRGWSVTSTGAFFGEFWTEASSTLTEAVSAGSVNNNTGAVAGTAYNLNVVS